MRYKELEKYQIRGQFVFRETDDLKIVCNASKVGMGVYLVYAQKEERTDLIYIGSSGKVKQDGSSKVRKGAIFDRIVNGDQFGNVRRRTWKQKLVDESIKALEVNWYVTFDDNCNDIPVVVEGRLLQEFFIIKGVLPKWNKEF